MCVKSRQAQRKLFTVLWKVLLAASIILFAFGLIFCILGWTLTNGIVNQTTESSLRITGSGTIVVGVALFVSSLVMRRDVEMGKLVTRRRRRRRHRNTVSSDSSSRHNNTQVAIYHDPAAIIDSVSGAMNTTAYGWSPPSYSEAIASEPASPPAYPDDGLPGPSNAGDSYASQPPPEPPPNDGLPPTYRDAMRGKTDELRARFEQTSS